MNVTALEFGTTPPVTVTVDTTAPVPVHAPLVKRLYVTVPATWNPPVMVEESEAELPTTTVVEDTTVLMDGLAFWTVSGSQALVAALLLASPEYAALKLKLPVLLNVTAREFGTMPLDTVTTDATVPGAEQRPLLNTVYVTVPPALNPLVRVEESVTVVPTTGLVEERDVAIVGLALCTVNGSQALVAALLFASPE